MEGWNELRRPPILDQLSALADTTRARLLLVLGQHELTVSELCSVLELPQSTVSRHLKVLADGEWVHARREGTSRLYTLIPGDLDPAPLRLWSLAREQLAATVTATEDARRLERVLSRRRERSLEFFASVAGQWDRMRDDLFGPRVCALSLLALLPGEWTVADLGCGTGPVAESVAPFVKRVIAVDDSEAMLAAARERLERFTNVEMRRGMLEQLPLEDGQLDAAILMLVLHHASDPVQVMCEVARTLRPGGSFLVVDMLPHDRQEYRQQMGHVWLGFSDEQLGRMLDAAGLQPGPFLALPTEAGARGPSLFAASGTRPPAGLRGAAHGRRPDEPSDRNDVSRKPRSDRSRP